jgi:hypothetical protein
MNRYILIRRLRGPAFLLLVGTLALLNQADIMSWGHSWPFFLILAGVMALAERAALAADGPYAGTPAPSYTGPAPAPGQTTESTAIVPTYEQGIDRDPEERQR